MSVLPIVLKYCCCDGLDGTYEVGAPFTSFRDIIIAPSILIQLYMTAIILWKGKNLYKVLSMILILSVIIVSTYITVILAFTVSPQETWLWVHIIHPIFNVPNT